LATRYRVFVKSKIQRPRVTDKNLRYEGSLELDEALLGAADIMPGEVIQVVNVNNGARFETYAIAAPRGSGRCVLNGGAARLGEIGDELIVLNNVLVPEEAAGAHRMRLVKVDDRNSIVDDSGRPGSR
jgi:aspartate 1-decarboxylase